MRQARRKEGRHAVGELAAADRLKGLVRRIAEVSPAASVRMDVDEARQQRETLRLQNLLVRRGDKPDADLGNLRPQCYSLSDTVPGLFTCITSVTRLP